MGIRPQQTRLENTSHVIRRVCGGEMSLQKMRTGQPLSFCHARLDQAAVSLPILAFPLPPCFDANQSLRTAGVGSMLVSEMLPSWRSKTYPPRRKITHRKPCCACWPPKLRGLAQIAIVNDYHTF